MRVRVAKLQTTIMEKRESEKDLEKALFDAIKERGGIALKNTSQFHRGIPDRQVLLPYATSCFVELKSSDGRLSALQLRAMRKLTDMRHHCWVISSMEDLRYFLSKMDQRIARFQRAEQEDIDE